MKLEKKMATLLAAVLIAMMGVMPVLAADNSLGLSVTVVEFIALSITADVEDLAFDSVYQGAEPSRPLTITVTGTSAADIDTTVTDAEGTFWYDNLYLGLVKANAFTATKIFEEDLTITTDAILIVPSLATPGSYTGTLVFWATTTG